MVYVSRNTDKVIELKKLYIVLTIYIYITMTFIYELIPTGKLIY